MAAPESGNIAVLAEKPSVARDIARVLGATSRGGGYLHGNGYVVTWALGHLAALAQPHEINPEWRHWRRELLPILPNRWPLVVYERTKDQFEVVRKILNSPRVSRVVCATDAGREVGHEAGAKSHEAWQHVLGSFATKGFVALAWDPISQGERVQFFDPDLRASRLGASTREHTMLGVQTLVTGDSIARYTIWDGIRALDYLVSRKEVDPERVGVTGNSGGGTHTAYLAAIDDRLKVAAPSCYITNWSRLLAQLGPQDAEQNLPPFLNLGYDFPDLSSGLWRRRRSTPAGAVRSIAQKHCAAPPDRPRQNYCGG